MSLTVPEVSFDYNEALELVTAVASLSSTQQRVTANASLLPPERDEITLWRKRINDTFSPFERSDLDLVCSTVTAFVSLSYLAFREETRTPETLISSLRSMSDAEFVDGFRRALMIEEYTDADPKEWLKEEIIVDALDKDRDRETIPFAEESKLLIDLLSSPSIFRTKTADVLENVHTRFIAPHSARIADTVQSRIAEWKEEVFRDVPDALRRLSRGNYDTLLAGRDHITILPVHFASRERSIFIPGDAIMIIGIDRAAMELAPNRSDEETRALTRELLKAISDPTRLAILRLVRQRPRYSKELATELGVSAPTASYHVDKLIQTNLLRLELPQGRRFYYTVNPDGIESLRESLEREFL